MQLTDEELAKIVNQAYEQGWEDARYWPHQRNPSCDIQRYGETQTLLIRQVGGDHRATKLLP